MEVPITVIIWYQIIQLCHCRRKKLHFFVYGDYESLCWLHTESLEHQVGTWTYLSRKSNICFLARHSCLHGLQYWFKVQSVPRTARGQYSDWTIDTWKQVFNSSSCSRGEKIRRQTSSTTLYNITSLPWYSDNSGHHSHAVLFHCCTSYMYVAGSPTSLT